MLRRFHQRASKAKPSFDAFFNSYTDYKFHYRHNILPSVQVAIAALLEGCCSLAVGILHWLAKGPDFSWSRRAEWYVKNGH
jgi:hypothetical protein